MKKIIVSLITIVLIMCTFICNVNAAEISKTECKNGKITINGTGSGKIQIVLFNSKNQPMYMTTAESENGVFSITLPKIDNLDEGEYKIKTANYDGHEVKEKDIEITKADLADTSENTEEIIDNSTKSSNPKTGDMIILAVALLIVGILGFIYASVRNRKNNKKKNH